MSRILSILFIGLMVWAGNANAQTDERIIQASKLIQSLADKAPVLLKPSKKSLELRERAIQAELKQHVDFTLMASVIMGAYWREMAAQQKDEFLDLFSDFFLKSYTPLLGGYPGDILKLRFTRKNGSKDVFVRTQLQRQNRKTVISDWRMRQSGTQHKIIDLNISGISVIISHRESFHRHLGKSGVDGLLKLLRIRAERLTAQS